MAERLLPCIYCGRAADTSDHVPPRLLLRQPYPVPMTTVPSCRACNQGASLDEEYFRVVLAQVGVSAHLSDMVAPGGVVDRALTRSVRLSQRIEGALTVAPGGRVMIAPEHERINRVLGKIAHGLFVVRYARNPGGPIFTRSACFHSASKIGGPREYSSPRSRSGFSRRGGQAFRTRFSPTPSSITLWTRASAFAS